jgi:hypothetical protein
MVQLKSLMFQNDSVQSQAIQSDEDTHLWEKIIKAQMKHAARG